MCPKPHLPLYIPCRDAAALGMTRPCDHWSSHGTNLGSSINPKGIALYSPRLPSMGEATLGLIVRKISNRNAVAHLLASCHLLTQPRWGLMSAYNAESQGSAYARNLGLQSGIPLGFFQIL